MKFKIGQHIKMVANRDRAKRNMTGTIKIINTDDNHMPYGIKFDENFGGHQLDGYCEDGYGHWVKETDMMLICKTKKRFKLKIIK